MRSQRKEGRGQQSADRDDAAAAKQYHKSGGDGTNEARRQKAWKKDGGDRATAPLLASAGAARGGKRDAVRGRWRGTEEILRGAGVPAAMVVEAALPG